MSGYRRLLGLLALPALACAETIDHLPGFSPSLWRFAQVIPLRRSRVGGWQEACAHLQFVDGRSLLKPPHRWTCGIEVGMPLATSLDGPLSPDLAARIAAATATKASGVVFHSRPAWLGEDFCIALRTAMQETFEPSLGAKVQRCP